MPIPGTDLWRRKGDERLADNIKLERISLRSRNASVVILGPQRSEGTRESVTDLRTLQGRQHLSGLSEAPPSSLSQEFLKARPAEMQQASVVARLKIDIGLLRQAVIHNDF